MQGNPAWAPYHVSLPQNHKARILKKRENKLTKSKSEQFPTQSTRNTYARELSLIRRRKKTNLLQFLTLLYVIHIFKNN